MAGKLKDRKDREAILTAMARSTHGFEDNPYARHMSRLEVARFVTLLGLSQDKKDVEPMLVHTIQLPVREPSDAEVREHFERWEPLKSQVSGQVPSHVICDVRRET